MTITRFAPFRSPLTDVALLQNRLNSIFSDFTHPAGESGAASTDTLATGNFVPAVDVYEDAQKLVLKLEVPGIPPENLNIHLENRTLTIRGERKFEAEEKEENFTRVERRYGNFIRSFTLPASVSTEDVQATTENGVLSLSFTRKPESKPRQIEVKVGAPSAAKQVEAQAAPAKQA